MASRTLESNTAAQQNWLALKRLAAEHFKSLRQQNPDWTLEDLTAALTLPRTAMLLDLAASVGFTCAEEPTPAEICEVLTQYVNGVLAVEVIVQTTGVSAPKVRRILETRAAGWGKAPFGCTPYGGNRAVSDGKASVCRRTTIKGQLSYRGQRYSLGALYRGRTVFVRERERELVVTCEDRSPLRISRYNGR